jgi:ABC-2 type transport system permease protein
MSTLDSARAIRLITRREISSRLLSKPFVAGVAATVVLIFGAFGLGTLIGGDDEVTIGLTGDQPGGAVEGLETAAARVDTELQLVDFASLEDADAALDAGDVDGVVANGREIRMRETNDEVVALVTPVWQQASLVDGLADQGLTSSSIASAIDGAAPLAVVELEPNPEGDEREAIAFFTVILLFIAIQVAGAYILMGVFEEKSSKVVELVLSSVRAQHLLLGKIIGVGVLGLVQVAVLAGSAVAAASLFGSDALPALTADLIAAGLLWFVLGYLLYGSVFAAGASLAPRQEDAQSTLAPISVVLMLSYFGAIFAASDPESTLATIVSWVPLTAPFAMPGRIALGDAQWWEVAGAMTLTAVTAAVVLRFAERIYVRSVIHTDRKLGWREAWVLEA